MSTRAFDIRMQQKGSGLGVAPSAVVRTRSVLPG